MSYAMNLQEIKSRTDIVKLACDLGLDIKVTSTGGTAFCPLCDSESGHSRHMSFHREKGVFRCNKCSKSGDHITLIQLVKNVSVSEAILSIRTMGEGIFVNPGTKCQIRPIWTPKGVLPLFPPMPEEYSRIYELLLTEKPISDKVYNYLHCTRSLNAKTLHKYRISSIENPDATLQMLRFHHTDEQLKAAGLLTANGKFIFSAPCILFPHIENGKVTYISNRNLTGHPKSFKLAGITSRPYIGSEVNESSDLFVFEGIINGLSYEELRNKGNFIAMMGTVSPQQYKQIQNQFPDKDIWLALDPDKPGIEATNRIPGAKAVEWIKIFNQFTAFDSIPVHPDGKEWDLNDLLVWHNDWLYSISGSNINDGMSLDEADKAAKNIIFK